MLLPNHADEYNEQFETKGSTMIFCQRRNSCFALLCSLYSAE